MRFRFAWALMAGLLAVVVGCTSSNTEKVSEEMEPAAHGTAASTEAVELTTEPVDSANGITWDVPEGFKKQAPSSAMRVAQYALPAEDPHSAGGELVMFFFGTGVGGDTQSNIARWARQFKQPDDSDAMANATLDSFESESGMKVSTIELTGIYQPGTMSSGPSFDHPGWALYGAVVEGEAGPWFFKAVGPEAVIERYRGGLLSMYKTLRPTSL